MTALVVFAPHMLYAAGLVASLFVVTHSTTFQTSARFQIFALLIAALVYTIVFIVLLGLTPDRWMHAVATQNWREETRDADTAIVLGFGYEKDATGTMQAGKANRFLLDWVIDNTSATTIFVQEGVWIAACGMSPDQCTYSGRELKRIHLHDEKIYVNTLDTAFCAMEQMARIHKSKAALVAHDLQLQRAAWDVERVKRRSDWHSFIFVIPEIPDTPCPANSVHWQTRNQFIYKVVELLISRPRDFLTPVPGRCKAPLQ